MIAAVRRLWRSVAFRIALHYGLLTLFFMAVLLAIVYWQTVVVQQHRTDRQIVAAAQRLAARFALGGQEDVAEQIALQLVDGVDSDSEVYLLQDAAGRAVAGNLAPSPDWTRLGDAVVPRTARRSGQPASLRVQQRRFPDGSILVVGRDLREQHRMERVVGHATLAAGLVALLLVGIGAYLFRRDVEGSIAGIRRTAARIEAGELDQRIPATGEGDEFAHLGHDINRMLDRIEELMHGVRHVSDTIAHNLRTPLSRILLQLRAAQRPDASVPELRAAVDGAVTEVEALAVVFDKLLRIAEAETGARRHGFSPLALGDVLADLAELYDAVVEAQGATLHLAAAPDAVVRGDRDLLANAVANLLDNALKYGGPTGDGRGATIRLRCERRGDRCRLVVEDDGPGIPAEERSRLGTRFHRLRAAVEADAPGVGLGLASVRAVAHLHGGTMAVEDGAGDTGAAGGRGTAVVLDLPAHDR
ncbi:ATP-binding protein [uncultured Xylophilus sp.]|uniref:ATP-binding protein n=1 Tax=uncultured Xylophilus sp. TaxID=296832 RepID=UPI0025EF3C48|nr:ATP-binding protein [uncultured Xylophilus sp.]